MTKHGHSTSIYRGWAIQLKSKSVGRTCTYRGGSGRGANLRSNIALPLLNKKWLFFCMGDWATYAVPSFRNTKSEASELARSHSLPCTDTKFHLNYNIEKSRAQTNPRKKNYTDDTWKNTFIFVTFRNNIGMRHSACSTRVCIASCNGKMFRLLRC